MTLPAPPVNALHDRIEPDLLAPLPARTARRRIRGAWLLGLSALVATMFLAGYVPRQQQRARLATSAASLAVQLPRVSLVRPARNKQPRTLTLPASLQGLEETMLYARADGYVSALHADRHRTRSRCGGRAGERTLGHRVADRQSRPPDRRRLERAGPAALSTSRHAIREK